MGAIAYQEPVRVVLFIERECVAFLERELLLCRSLVLVHSNDGCNFGVLFSVERNRVSGPDSVCLRARARALGQGDGLSQHESAFE